MRIPLSVEAIARVPCNGLIPPKRRPLPPGRLPNGAGQETGHRGGGADQRWPAGATSALEQGATSHRRQGLGGPQRWPGPWSLDKTDQAAATISGIGFRSQARPCLELEEFEPEPVHGPQASAESLSRILKK